MLTNGPLPLVLLARQFAFSPNGRRASAGSTRKSPSERALFSQLQRVVVFTVSHHTTACRRSMRLLDGTFLSCSSPCADGRSAWGLTPPPGILATMSSAMAFAHVAVHLDRHLESGDLESGDLESEAALPWLGDLAWLPPALDAAAAEIPFDEADDDAALVRAGAVVSAFAGIVPPRIVAPLQLLDDETAEAQAGRGPSNTCSGLETHARR